MQLGENGWRCKGKLGVGKRHKGKIRREEIKGINAITEK
jgi:hypothetical protein